MCRTARTDGAVPQSASADVVGFSDVTIETFVGAIEQAGRCETAHWLNDRYCDYRPLDALL